MDYTLDAITSCFLNSKSDSGWQPLYSSGESGVLHAEAGRCRESAWHQGSDMKCKRRGRPAAQAEACDVWLDTTRLKQCTVQSLIAKPKVSNRILERKRVGYASFGFTQTRASQSCTKQTTISAFFSTQTDEKDKENSRPAPFIPSRECKEKLISLAATPVKILAFPQMEEAQKQSFRTEDETVQVTPQRCAQKAQSLQTLLPGSPLLQAESHSESEAPYGAREDGFDITRDSEGSWLIAHRNVSNLFAGEMVSANDSRTSRTRADWVSKHKGQVYPEERKTGVDFQPRLAANQNKKPHQQSVSANSFIYFSQAENINPTITRESTWVAGLYSSPKRLANIQPLREHSQNADAGSAEEDWANAKTLSSPWSQLFTQDSEGNRVISHHCQNGRGPQKDESSVNSRRTSSLCKDCSNDAANRNLSEPGEYQLDECYDILLAQDSEGNRVIKHWANFLLKTSAIRTAGSSSFTEVRFLHGRQTHSVLVKRSAQADG